MRWLLWCFCLLAESYETINHYHYKHLVWHSTSAVMALLCQIYSLPVNLPNFSSSFRNFVKSFIKIFQTSVEYIWCEIISADDSIVRVVKLSDRRNYCQDIFHQWCYFNCRYETSSANWNTLESNAAGTGSLRGIKCAGARAVFGPFISYN